MKSRTFFTTLLLFLAAVNLGISLVSFSTFQDTLRSAKERSLGEHYFITSALIKDLQAVERRGMDSEGSIGDLLQTYRYLSEVKQVRLALYKAGRVVYANRLELTIDDRFLHAPDNGDRLVSVQKADGRTYVIVSGKLPPPHHAYTMVYLYDTTDALHAWKQTKNTLFFAGCALSLLFAAGHLILLNRIFRPLSQIAQTSRRIAAGAYETRLPVSGQGELSEMAQSFNHMAEAIQRQMAELVSAAENRQQFIDNFAHELRTPLTAIYGYAEYLQKACLTEDDRLSALHYIMSESRRLQTLAHQLLELAKLRNDQLVWEANRVSELFQSVKQTLHQQISKKAIDIRFDCELDVLWGDACLLKSLFVNLIDNAIKACDEGGRIVVRVALEGGKPTVSIRDNGKGMSPEMLQRITEPFYRGEKSRSLKDGGAGLGLAICKQIVLRHGANLRFASEPGKGTTASVMFTTPT